MTRIHPLLYPIIFKRRFIANPFNFENHDMERENIKFEPFFVFVFPAEAFKKSPRLSNVYDKFHRSITAGPTNTVFFFQYVTAAVTEYSLKEWTDPLQYAVALADRLVHNDANLDSLMYDGSFLCDVYALKMSECDRFITNNLSSHRPCITGDGFNPPPNDQDDRGYEQSQETTIESQMRVPFRISVPSRAFNQLIANKKWYHEIFRHIFHPGTRVVRFGDIPHDRYLRIVVKRLNSSGSQGVFLNEEAIRRSGLNESESVIVQPINYTSEHEIRFHTYNGSILYGVHYTGVGLKFHGASKVCQANGDSSMYNPDQPIRQLYNRDKAKLIYAVRMIWLQVKAMFNVCPDAYLRIDMSLWPDGHWYLNELESFACEKGRIDEKDKTPLEIIERIWFSHANVDIPPAVPLRLNETVENYMNHMSSEQHTRALMQSIFGGYYK